MRTKLACAFFSAAAIVLSGSATKADSIEAIKGKEYALTKRHGPWMVMVASFNRPPENRRGEGLSPEDAAKELIYELRRKGIPAYMTKQREEIQEDFKTVSRRTQAERTGKVRVKNEGVCVLAGNYPTSDDVVGQKTLKYIKSFQPRLLGEVEAQGKPDDGSLIKRLKSGGIYRVSKVHPGPLSGAFMTTNPVLSPEELASRIRDPLILQLNSGTEYSLLQNKAKYTIVVATFQGKSQTQIGTEVDENKLKVNKNDLFDEAQRAWELCNALRRAKSLGYEEDFPAYLYHDRYSSIVTIGSFNDPNDPRIESLQNKFGAKVAKINQDGTPAIGAEIFTIPRDTRGKRAVKSWIFDPYPRVIDVPKFGRQVVASNERG